MPLDLTTPEIRDVWTRWALERREEDRNRLLEHYLPILPIVARRVLKPLGKQGEHVDSEDILAYGVFGLLDAIERFDPNLGHRFESYALDRVRGAILDELRKPNESWVPRIVKDRARALVSALSRIEARLGREPSERELAVELGWSLERVREARVWASSLDASSFDVLSAGGSHVGPPVAGSGADVDVLAERLARGVARLDDRHRTVLALYYIEEMSFAEVGDALDISKARVSQLLTEALAELADRWEAA